MKLLAFATALWATLLPSMASAQDASSNILRVGSPYAATTLDPHFHKNIANTAIKQAVFDALTEHREGAPLIPRLATRWDALDETQWEFQLRDNVLFSDGSRFTSRDVAFSICRVPRVERNPSSYENATRSIQFFNISSANTIRLRTNLVNPLLDFDLASVAIVKATDGWFSERVSNISEWHTCPTVAAYPSTADFNSVKASIGTGPYTVASYVPGEIVELRANPHFWGAKVDWERLFVKPLLSNPARVAALLAGDVDVIWNVPAVDVDTIARRGYEVASFPTSRLFYLHYQMNDQPPPGVAAPNSSNPFRDRRVREALSLAINRQTISDRVLGDGASPATSLLPKGLPGGGATVDHSYDPAQSRALLAQAGYPNGFAFEIAVQEVHFAVAEVLAQMLSRVGLRASINRVSTTAFFSNLEKGEYGIWLANFGADGGQIITTLRNLVGTRDRATGTGVANRAGYSNRQLDALRESAAATMNEVERDTKFTAAAQLALDDIAIIPLAFEGYRVAHRRGLTASERQNYLLEGITKSRK